MKKFLSILLALMLVCLITACGSDNSDNNTSTSDSAKTETSDTTDSNDSDKSDTKSSDSNTTYTVGSTITENGISATLDSVTTYAGDEYSDQAEGNIYLNLNWTIKNDSDEDHVITMINNGYVDGVAIDTAYAHGGPDVLQLGSTLIPGTQASGAVTFEVPENWQKFQDRVEIYSMSENPVVFEITPDQVTNE